MKHSIAPQRLNVAFDDDSLIANAGLLPATLLLDRLAVGELADRRLILASPAAGPNPGDKLSTLICSSLVGGDCIDDAEVLRTGDTGRILGFKIKAPSTLGTFLRSFRWHNVRQLDAVGGRVLKNAWAMGAGPGAGPLTIDVDSTFCQTHGALKQGTRDRSYTGQHGYHPLIATVAGSGEVLHARLRRGNAYPGRGGANFAAEAIARARRAGAAGPVTVRADAGFYDHKFIGACRRAGVRFSVTARDMRGSISRMIARIPEEDFTPISDCQGAEAAEIAYAPFPGKIKGPGLRLIVRRVRKDLGPLLAEQPRYRHHAFVTDRAGSLLHLEQDHRRHAECECVICDLKHGVGLNHFPSGNFFANAAWLWVQTTAHNLCRWLRQIGDPRQGVMTALTVRRRILSLPGRLTRSGRRDTLRLPRAWPWAAMFLRILSATRARPAPA